jgi:hypothetical protein
LFEEKSMDNQNKVIVHTHWAIKVIALIGLLIGGLFLYAYVLNPSSDIWRGVLLFFLCGLLWILASSNIEMSDQYILVQVPYGRFKINWDEVKYVETDGALFAFTGEEKRVVIAIPLMSSSKKKMCDLMNSQIEKRKIRIKQSAFVPKTHKNSRTK